MTLESGKRFHQDVGFSDVEEIYSLDSELRRWMLDAIEPAEVKLRSQLAHHLALIYSAGAFCSHEPFLSVPQWEGSVKAAGREINRARRDGKPSVCHNLEA